MNADISQNYLYSVSQFLTLIARVSKRSSRALCCRCKKEDRKFHPLIIYIFVPLEFSCPQILPKICNWIFPWPKCTKVKENEMKIGKWSSDSFMQSLPLYIRSIWMRQST